MTTIQTASSVYAIDEITGDIVNLPERGCKNIKLNNHKPYIATPEDIARELQLKLQTEKKQEVDFKDWLDCEMYYMAQSYRNALMKEIEGAKQVSANISKDLPIIMDALKKIALPKVRHYEGGLSKEKQLKIYNEAKKPDFNKIFHETIKNNLC